MRRADIEVPNHPVDMDSWGIFGAAMKVSLVNDGPVTILLDRG